MEKKSDKLEKIKGIQKAIGVLASNFMKEVVEYQVDPEETIRMPSSVMDSYQDISRLAEIAPGDTVSAALCFGRSDQGLELLYRTSGWLLDARRCIYVVNGWYVTGGQFDAFGPQGSYSFSYESARKAVECLEGAWDWTAVHIHPCSETPGHCLASMNDEVFYKFEVEADRLVEADGDIYNVQFMLALNEWAQHRGFDLVEQCRKIWTQY